MPFSSEEHLNRWLKRRGLKTGSIISMETCWELGQRWYAGRAERDWQRPDAEATQHLFSNLGLTGDFWKVK